MKIRMKKRNAGNFKKRLTALMLCAALSLFAACADADRPDPETGRDLPKNAAPQKASAAADFSDLTVGFSVDPVSAGQEREPSATAAATDFGLQMLCGKMQPGENILLSPVSVLFALGMTANGARGNTLTQFETAFGISVDELNKYLYAYRQSLPCEESCKVTVANSIWFKEDPELSVLPDFLQMNADYYGAGICEAPFDDSTKDAVNDWVKKNTDGMIRQILDRIPKDSVMYLINAMAFDAKWREPYREHDIREGDFTRADGTTLQADFMYSRENEYLEDDHAVGFLKYYEGGKYAFAALLPEEGMSPETYAATLTGEKLNRILTSPATLEVRASIPKFEAEYGAELENTLAAMGISDAFNPSKADFTGLATYTGENISISRVLHKTYICVDEKGTKAAAVTAVELLKNESLEEPNYKTVYLNRPFLYFLIDCEEGLPVFMGVVSEPK